jgi:pyridoxine kinase
LIEIYKNEVIQHAHILMPNRYEAELLTGTTINDEKDAKNVCDLLHQKGIQIVVLKSLDFEEDFITLIGSQKDSKKFKIKVKKVKGYFTGTGDLIAALILATTTLYKY